MKTFSLVFLSLISISIVKAQSDWSKQTSGVTQDLYGIFFIDANNGWAVGDAGTIIHTTNGGSSWEKQTSGSLEDFSAVVFFDVNSGWVTGSNGIILHTTNGGTNWVSQANPLSGKSSTIKGLSFVDANIGWASTIFTILHTTDGGTNWTVQVDSVGPCGDLSFSDANNGFVSGLDGMLWHTTNGGTTWIEKASGIRNMLMAISNPVTNRCCTVGDAGHIFTTTDGINWVKQSSGTNNLLIEVDFADANNGWAVGVNNTILHTADGGTTWISQHEKVDGQYLLSVSFPDIKNGWVTGASGLIQHTTNGGGTGLSAVNSPIVSNSLEIFPNPATTNLYVKLNHPAFYQLVNIYGQSVLIGALNQGLSTIDVSNLKPGLYFLVTVTNNLTQSGKVIIQ